MWIFFKNQTVSTTGNPVQTTLDTPPSKNKNFFKNEDGTTAIEFAILGLPFLALLFGIIELAIVFFVSSTAQHALETSAREIRTGEYQLNSGTVATLETSICGHMGNNTSDAITQCTDKLTIDGVTSPTGSFSDITLPASALCSGSDAEIEQCMNENPTVADSDVICTTGGQIMVVRLQYHHSLSVPFGLTRLANTGNNTRVISHTTAFRNEPFSFNCP